MQIYAFIGKTGTGKSYHALSVAHKHGIRYIIDDAILIKDNKVICGKSAKTEGTKIASVKAAIFLDKYRRELMQNALRAQKPDKLLILGTSDKMVEEIVANLEIGKIDEKIYIEDVATKETIEYARKQRKEEGKHVVPVPTFEIKEQFSGYFLDPVRIFNSFLRPGEEPDGEKTIIRPTYSYLGKYYIAEKVLNDIISYVTTNVAGVTKVYKALCNKFVDGIKIDIDIETKYGYSIPIISNRVRNAIIIAIDRSTGINILEININVKGISK